VDDGVLRVATTPFSAPLDFYADDNTTPIGNETDIAQLVADALGLQLELVPTAWENWPLATRSGEVDATIANVTVTEERKQLFDFSSYRVDELGFLATADSGLRIEEPADVAGHTVAVGSGTNQEKILLAWDEQNRAAGLAPVDVQYYQSDSDATVGLQSGRIDLHFGPNATAAYKAATAPQDFAVVGTVNGGWPDTAQIAVTTAKGNGLAAAFTAALNGAIADGSYQEVLDRWGLGAEAVQESQTNPPGLAALK
jgi:polar amino acid transport system substrate-binding protein